MDKTKIKLLTQEYKTANADRRKSIKREMVDIVADYLKPEAVKMVKHIEAKPETTRYHYGDYMRVLSSCPDMLSRLGIAKAMLDAGASQGLNDAMKLL